MRKILMSLAVIVVMSSGTLAQVAQRRPFVRAAGEGVVSISPDQVKVNVGVVTQAMTAQEASEQNAGQVAAVLAQLRALLGANADIKTVSYSVTPNYRYPQGGGTPVLTGYTAANTVEVTSNTLSMAGRIIDTATSSGATTVHSLRFTLRDPQPARAQALRQATIQARGHAEAIAAGLGARLGNVLAAEEGGSIRISPTNDGRTTAPVATPVEPGTLEVRASVTLEVEIVQ